MRVAIYVRVSTDEQAREGFSIDAQKRRLAAFADSQDWTLSDLYIDDGYSAKDLNRPGIKRMITDLELGKFEVVLVYKLDRLTRSTSDCDHLLKMFEAHKVAFQSCTESFETRTATGRLFIRLIADIAQWERENIGERVRFGMEQKAIEGKKPGGRYPYGYNKKGELIPEEAAAIRKLRDLYMKENIGFKSIAMRMNNEGISRRNYDWRSSTVALTLENPFYAGIVEYGGKMVNGRYPQRNRELRVDVIRSQGNHEAVFTEEEFNEHVRFMRKRTDGGFSRKLDYWFTGLLRCGRCGYSMFGRLTHSRKHVDGTIVRTPYYICSTRKDNSKCTMPTFQQKHIEHMLMEYIKGVRLDQHVTAIEQRKMKNMQASREKAIQKFTRDLEAIKERIKKWQYMFINDLIKADDLRERLDNEYVLENETLRNIEDLKTQEKETPEVQGQLFSLSDLWPHMDDMERKEMLSTIFEEIKVMTDEVNPKGVKNKFFNASIEVTYR